MMKRFLPVTPDASGPAYDPPLPPEMRQISISAPNGISPIVEVGFSCNEAAQQVCFSVTKTLNLNYNFLISKECLQDSGLKLITKQAPDPASLCLIWDTLPASEKGKDEINFSAVGAGVKINQFPGLYVIGRKVLAIVSVSFS